MVVRLEMKETFPYPDDDVVKRYKAVETPDRETTIQEFVNRFAGYHDPAGLTHMLELHDDFWLEEQHYTFSDENGPLISAISEGSNGESS